MLDIPATIAAVNAAFAGSDCEVRPTDDGVAVTKDTSDTAVRRTRGVVSRQFSTVVTLDSVRGTATLRDVEHLAEDEPWLMGRHISGTSSGSLAQRSVSVSFGRRPDASAGSRQEASFSSHDDVHAPLIHALEASGWQVSRGNAVSRTGLIVAVVCAVVAVAVLIALLVALVL